jgi:hypothetical protein
MVVKFEFTAAEAKSLLQAACLVLADEFDGTEQQRAALERAKEKLALQTVMRRRLRD